MGHLFHSAAVLLLAHGCAVTPAEPVEIASSTVTASVDDAPVVRCVVSIAEDEVGVKEETANSGERVDQYLASVKINFPAYWCAAFVHWSHRQCGNVLEPAREFAMAARFARERVVFKKGDLDKYQTTRDGHVLQRISTDGDVFTLYYANLGRPGHCGIIVGEDDDYVTTVEGNTGDGGSRNGDGVYRRMRDKETLWTVSNW